MTWPVLTTYGGDPLNRIAMPLGGIGTHNSIVEEDPPEIEANLANIPYGEMRQMDGEIRQMDGEIRQMDGPLTPNSEFWAPYANGTTHPDVRRLVTCASEGWRRLLAAYEKCGPTFESIEK